MSLLNSHVLMAGFKNFMSKGSAGCWLKRLLTSEIRLYFAPVIWMNISLLNQWYYILYFEKNIECLSTTIFLFLFLNPDISAESQLLEMTETKLSLEQGALTLSNAQVSFRTLNFTHFSYVSKPQLLISLCSGHSLWSKLSPAVAPLVFVALRKQYLKLNLRIYFGRLTSIARNSRFAVTTWALV